VKDLLRVGEERNPDAELIRLCEESIELERQFDTFFDGPNDIEDDDEREKHTGPIKEMQRGLAKQMGEMRATTLEGYLARIRVIAANGTVLPDEPETLVQSPFLNECLLGFLLRDLAEQAGTRRPS
jgi:hypothetical protein